MWHRLLPEFCSIITGISSNFSESTRAAILSVLYTCCTLTAVFFCARQNDFLWYKLCIGHRLTPLCPKITLCIHAWPSGPSCRRPSECQPHHIYIIWAKLHLCVADCAPFLTNHLASASAGDYFNMNPMSGRQYLRRKHLGLLPLNPLWVRAGVLGCESDHARKSNDGCLMTRMASPILTRLIYKRAAELRLPSYTPTDPLCPSYSAPSLGQRCVFGQATVTVHPLMVQSTETGTCSIKTQLHWYSGNTQRKARRSLLSHSRRVLFFKPDLDLGRLLIGGLVLTPTPVTLIQLSTKLLPVVIPRIEFFWIFFLNNANG